MKSVVYPDSSSIKREAEENSKNRNLEIVWFFFLIFIPLLLLLDSYQWMMGFHYDWWMQKE